MLEARITGCGAAPPLHNTRSSDWFPLSETRGRYRRSSNNGGPHGYQCTDGDNHRNGAVRKRTQLKDKVMGETAFIKRDKSTGEFTDQKPGKKFKGVTREK